MDLNSIVCPVSTEKIDSNTSRLTIFLNVILMAAFLYSNNPGFILIVAIDYSIRAFFNVKSSLIRVIAQRIATTLKWDVKLVGIAPKTFASRLGAMCAGLAFALQLVGLNTASIAVATMLMVLATLDSVFNFCVGCLIYNYIVLPFYKDK